MTHEEYASKASAVGAGWADISSQPPGPVIQEVFNVLRHSEVHDDATPSVEDGYHVEVISEGQKYRTLFFSRPLTQDEKAEIGALYEAVKKSQNPST